MWHGIAGFVATHHPCVVPMWLMPVAEKGYSHRLIGPFHHERPVNASLACLGSTIPTKLEAGERILQRGRGLLPSIGPRA